MRPTGSAFAMDGKLVTGIGLLAVPAVLLGVTVAFFSSNPVSIFVLIAAMIAGAFYLLTYRETFS
jgi:hypothetical protein